MTHPLADGQVHTCPVCGYPYLSAPPRSVTGSPSYEICPSCGFEFGVSDEDSGFSYGRYRQVWIAAGAEYRFWNSSEPFDGNFDGLAQVEAWLDAGNPEAYLDYTHRDWILDSDFPAYLSDWFRHVTSEDRMLDAWAAAFGRWICPACGYPGWEGIPLQIGIAEPVDDICPCCRFRFGYTDTVFGITPLTWGRFWHSNGSEWNGDLTPDPPFWDPISQFALLLERLAGFPFDLSPYSESE